MTVVKTIEGVSSPLDRERRRLRGGASKNSAFFKIRPRILYYYQYEEQEEEFVWELTSAKIL